MDTQVCNNVSIGVKPYGHANTSKAITPDQALNKLNKNLSNSRDGKTINNGLKADSEPAINKKNEHKETGAGEETRKIEIKDRELTVSVYNGKGRLVRVIPPGYVPPNTGCLKMFA
jgi:hypothetical protein